MPQTSILDRPLRKIARAEALFAEALHMLEAWAECYPPSAENAVGPDRLSIDVMVAVGQEPPLEAVSLIVGDAIHNLRSALDGMTWNIAHRDGPPGRPRDIQFPVADSEKRWKEASKKLVTIPPSALEKMRAVQPVTVFPDLGFIGILHDLDIRDKHHDFLTSHGQVLALQLSATFGVDAETEVGPLSGPIKISKLDGARLATLPFSKPIWEGVEPGGSVQIDITFAVEVTEEFSLDLRFLADVFPRATAELINDICRDL